MHETGRGMKAFDHPPVRGRAFTLVRADDLARVPPDVEAVVAVVKDPGAVWLRLLGDRLAAVVCTTGTPRSHVGILAASLGVPCVVSARVRGDLHGLDVEVDCSGEDGVVRA
ncbi:MAG TPA: PEP-utilizing enzyme [Acidimicrobiales bacterium]|nr:PEP-utilizing enzyme [Acidimicrobiales bacterium]